jgi:hypothetical protein
VTGFCEQGNELPGSIKFEEFLDWVITFFSRRTLLHGVSQSVKYCTPEFKILSISTYDALHFI